MDALYFRVSSEHHTTENHFEDLVQVAEKDGSGRDGPAIRRLLAACVYEGQVDTRTVYLRSSAANSGVSAKYCTLPPFSLERTALNSSL